MLIGYESSEEEVVRRRQKVTDLMMLGWKLTAWRRLRCLKPSTLKSWRFGGFCNVTFVHPYVECMLSKGSFVCPSWCTASNPDLTFCLVTSGPRIKWLRNEEKLTYMQGMNHLPGGSERFHEISVSCDLPTIIQTWHLHVTNQRSSKDGYMLSRAEGRGCCIAGLRFRDPPGWPKATSDRKKTPAMITCDYNLTMDIFMRKHPISL